MPRSSLRLPEPWDRLVSHNGYIQVRPNTYRCYFTVAALLDQLQAEPALHFRGPWYRPEQVVLRAPHLASRSFLLSRLLSRAGPRTVAKPTSFRLIWESWAGRFWQHDPDRFLSITPDGLVLDLQQLPPELQRILIVAVAESFGHSVPPPAIHDWITLFRLSPRTVTIHSNTLYLPEPLSRAVAFPLEELPMWLARMHAATRALSYRPLPGVPETIPPAGA